jgi:hypothetical protein
MTEWRIAGDTVIICTWWSWRHTIYL